MFAKGAPDVLLGRCSHEAVGEDRRPLTAERRTEILGANESLAGEALRTLGVALHWLPDDSATSDPGALGESVEQDLAFAGLIGMIDPPRAEARDAVARARGAGIRPIMITGDHPRTAAVIARELGITADDRARDRRRARSTAMRRRWRGPSPRSRCTRASTRSTSSAS